MPDICYTDASHTDVGVLRAASLNTTWGNSGNDFELTLDLQAPERLDYGAFVYVEGTEWGGVVDEREADSSSGTIMYRGRSWHGVLNDRILCPDSGADYLTVSGEANAVLLSLIARMGLTDVMTASTAGSGINVKHQFARYTDGYSGIRAMLSASGARLAVSYDSEAARVVLSAVPIVDWTDGPTTDVADVDVTCVSRPYNHLICLGSGELRDRVVQHWYADASGKVSGTQTLFGIDERATTYDYTNADADELTKQGPKKLAEYQTADAMEVTLSLDGSYAVGDIVPGTDVGTGTEVSVTVGTVDVTVDGGSVSVTYKAGGTASSGSSSGSSESSGSGGASYAAGDGITITGRTISADVTQDKLDAVVKTAEEASNNASGAATAVARETEARKAADTALSEAVSARVASVTGSGAVAASTDSSMAVTLSHAASGVTAGSYGPASNVSPKWGGTVTVGPRLSIDAKGHVTSAYGRTLTIPSAAATTSAAGLMSAADKKALDAVPSTYQPAGDYAAATHSHAATDISSGVLPIARGGTGNSTGKAATATKLATARTITLAGAVSGSASFDGSANVTITCEGSGSAASFLAAHPVGSVYSSTSSVSPAGTYGGTWKTVPSLGAFKWERTA
jgi:hypothetical protein